MSVKSIVSSCFPSFLRPVLDGIKNSPIGFRLAKGVFWLMAGMVISRGLMLAALVLVARMLGKIGFGELGMIRSSIGMLGAFAGFGLGLTATKYVAEFRQSDPARVGRIIGLSSLFAMVTGFVMAIGLFMFAPWFAEHTINAPHLVGILRIGGLILILNAFTGVQTGVLSGFEAFKTIACVNFFVGLISFPILISGAYFGGLTGVVWALTINLGINYLLNNLAIRKKLYSYKIPFTFKNCNRELSILWSFSLPAVLSEVLVSPVNWACSALLVNQPEGYSEMGIFSAANQWRMAILFIPGMVGKVVLPILSNLSSESVQQQYKKVVRINILLNVGIVLAIVLPLVLFADFVMRAYGPGFEQGVSVLRILAFTTILMAVNSVIGYVIISKGKMWIGFSFNVLWAIALLITTSIMLSKGYGALGLAYAALIAYILHTVWQSVYLSGILSTRDSPLIISEP